MRSRLLGVLAGLVSGAGLALAGILLAPDGAAEPVPTTTTLAAPPAGGPWWYDPNETVIGPGAIVLEGLRVDGDQALLLYRVEPISPAARGFGFGFSTPIVAPHEWTIETPRGLYPGRTRLTPSTQGGFVQEEQQVRIFEARFEVDEDFSVDEVTGITVDRYWMRIPYVYEIDMPATAGTSVRLDEDLEITIRRIGVQRDNVLVSFTVDHETEPFVSSQSPHFSIEGRGPGWRDRGSQFFFGGSFVFRPTATWEGIDLPDPIPLRVTSGYWVSYDGPIALDTGGLRSG